MQRTWRRFLAGAALVLVVTGTTSGIAAAQERRVALVVGNRQYREGGPAAAVGGNVDAMVAALRRAGFAVTAADDLDRRTLATELERFRDALGQADLGFLYYSGLAMRVAQRQYLLPIDAAAATAGDAAGGADGQAVDLDGLIGQLRQTGKRVVIVLDPVAGHPLLDRLARLPTAGGKAALGQPPEAERLFIVYAHRPDTSPVPARGSGPDVFTAALAREMVKPGVPLRDALAEVARAVVGRTGGRQFPWLQDRIGGDLVLVPGPPPQLAAVTPSSKPPPKPEPAKPEPQNPVAEDSNGTAAQSPAFPVPTPVLAPGTQAVTRSGTLFARPAIGARGLGSLEAGTVVTVVEAVAGGNWVRVRDRAGRDGFVTAGTLAGSWTEVDPLPPVAQAPRTPVEREPLAGTAGIGTGQPSGTSDPSEGGGPAILAEQQAYRAQREARAVAGQARGGSSDRLWNYGFPNGDVYQGASVILPDRMPGGRPVRQGFGVYRFADGQLYEGEWLADAMSGYGVLSFANGDRYAGTFRNGKPDGPGIYRYADGSRRGGLWRGTERVGE